MDSVLIVSSCEKTSSLFAEMISDEHYSCTDMAESADMARRLCTQREYGLVIINTPLVDEFGYCLTTGLLRETSSGVILITDPGSEHTAVSETAGHGAMVLTRPVDRKMFVRIVRFIAASQDRMSGVKRENLMLHKKLDDIKIINRAKSILMKYLSMTEQQAHRYLEKQAMDLRITRVEVAKNLLSTYDS